MNNNRVGTIVNSKKAPLYPQNGKKIELQGGKLQPAEKTTANRRRTSRERRLALLQDVDNLKKKLRHEENVHRALERAFNRPLGALPRLPPYLPQYTLELLAEVAVLEEEVVRLEEQLVNFRQGLYQETTIISSRRNAEDSTTSKNESFVKSYKIQHSRSLSQSEVNSGSRPSPSLSRSASSSRKFLSSDSVKKPQNGPTLVLEKVSGKENQDCPNSYKDKRSSREKESSGIENDTPIKRSHLMLESIVKNVNPLTMQCRIVEQALESSSDNTIVDLESEANKMSENILKCLISIFLRLSSSKRNKMDVEPFSSLSAREIDKKNVESDFLDPYFNSSQFKKREIGAYKNFHTIESDSIDLNRRTNASFLIARLVLLLDKLASVKLDGLSHQQKLAFWINIYNSCIMNAFLEHGIPDSSDMMVALMQKATVKMGGHVLNALMIEHFILRLPYHLKYTCSKSAKNDESKICRTFGLEWSEPLVTFGLSCGSWSSPAVRVYTASQVETELETAKRDYLQASVCISSTNQLIIPKLLDWYLLDFAKDLDALLDWVCLQLPNELRDEALKCLESRGKETLSKLVQVMPYNSKFRYLICR